MIDSIKKQINIEMNGEEYLNYLKFRKADWRIPESFKRFFSVSWIYFTLAGVLAFATAIIGSILSTPTTPKPFTYSVIYGFPVYHVVITFLMVAIGIAWILHGFGFIIIKR